MNDESDSTTESTIIRSSGDRATDALKIAIYHSTGDVTIDQACRIASALRETLFDEFSLEDWGLRLHAQLPGESSPR